MVLGSVCQKLELYFLTWSCVVREPKLSLTPFSRTTTISSTCLGAGEAPQQKGETKRRLTPENLRDYDSITGVITAPSSPILSPCLSSPAAMNVADLLHDAPSSQRRPPPREQPQAQQPPQQPQQTPSQPPHRERSRERERQPLGHSQHLPPPPHQHLHPSQSYHGHSSRSSRPGSPHRTFPPDYPGSHQQAQRLPPPSAILSDYDLKHRRPEFELPPLPHELGLRQQHGQQPSMGPPGECYCLR